MRLWVRYYVVTDGKGSWRGPPLSFYCWRWQCISGKLDKRFNCNLCFVSSLKSSGLPFSLDFLRLRPCALTFLPIMRTLHYVLSTPRSTASGPAFCRACRASTQKNMQALATHGNGLPKLKSLALLVKLNILAKSTFFQVAFSKHCLEGFLQQAQRMLGIQRRYFIEDPLSNYFHQKILFKKRWGPSMLMLRKGAFAFLSWEQGCTKGIQ